MNKNILRFDMARDPIRTRWYLKPITKLLSWPDVVLHKPIITRDGTDGLEPPFILLCNHIKDNQEAFNYGALEEFGMRDNHFEEDEQIISRETIEKSIDGGEAYRILNDGKPVGGVILKVDGDKGNLDILFTSPKAHSKGVGYAAWCEVEKLHPEVKIWETVTPYFEKRNIHFYVNRCGFHIVEFYNSHHPDPNDPDMAEQIDKQFPDGMFRFEKRRE